MLAYALARREAPEPLALRRLAGRGRGDGLPEPSRSPNPAALALGLGAILLARRAPAGGRRAGRGGVRLPVRLGLAAALGTVLRGAGPRRARRRAALRAPARRPWRALLLAPVVIAAPGELLGPDARLRARRAEPAAPAAARRLGRRLRAQQAARSTTSPTCCWRARRSGRSWRWRRRAPLRLWVAAPAGARRRAYLLARADEFHQVPLAAVLPVLLATAAARERAAGRARLARWRSLAVLAPDRPARPGPQAHPGARARRRSRACAPTRPTASRRRRAEARGAGRAGALRAAPGCRPASRCSWPTRATTSCKVGNPLVYVLLDRPNPTRYDVMQPGVVTTRGVQREMVARPRARAARARGPLAQPGGLGGRAQRRRALAAACGSSIAT